MTNDSLIERLEKQYSTQKGLNPAGACDLVRDFFAAIEIIRQHAQPAVKKTVREQLIDACNACGLDPEKVLRSEAEMEEVRQARDQQREITEINEAAFQYAYAEWKRPKAHIPSVTGALQGFLKRYLYAT